MTYLLVTHFVVATATLIMVWLSVSADTSTTVRLCGLLLLGGVYAETVDRVERVRIWLHTGRGASARQGGVLLFSGVLVLPTWAALVQTVVVFGHALLRNHRYRTQPTFQLAWTGTTVVVAAIAASATFHALAGHVSHPGLLDVLAIGLALVAYSGVNLGLLLSGMYLATRPKQWTALVPNRREIGYEAANLLIGVLGAVLIEQAALLTPVILLLAAMLHRSSLVRELMIDANTDAKTGLLTPKAWDRAAAAQLARCRRAGTSLAILAIDLDHFKAINDEHGHAAGDKVLEAVGALLSAQVRAGDIVGRYGGEEFVVLLPDATPSDAAETADRLRRHIAMLEPVTGVQVTASVGVASSELADIEISDLFGQADAAMYAAKASGRDRVTVAAGRDRVTVAAGRDRITVAA